MGLGLSERRFRLVEIVGGGGRWDSTPERVRGGGATVIPLCSSVRSALEVVRLAYIIDYNKEYTYFVRWLGGLAAVSSVVFISLVFLIN